MSCEVVRERGLGLAVLACSLPLVGERRGELKANKWLLSPPLPLVGVVGIGETTEEIKVKPSQPYNTDLQVCVIRNPGDGGTPPGKNLDMYANEFELVM